MALQTEFSDRLTKWRTSASGVISRIGDAIANARFPYRFPSVTWHILILNLFGLIFLVTGVFLVRSTEAWLIDAKRDSLEIQGEIIAAAIAGNAQVNTGRIQFNPDDLLPEFGRSLPEGNDIFRSLEFPIRPERVAPILKKLVQPTNTRARIYGETGDLILDSEYLESQTTIDTRYLPPPGGADHGPKISVFEQAWDGLLGWLNPKDLPVYKDIGGANGKAYPELVAALKGESTPMLLINERGQHMVSVAVPIQRMTRVLGVLLISTRGSEIDRLLRKERQSILWVATTACLAMLGLSALLAATISFPLHRLSQATERVRANLRSRESIPDYTHRPDEIGKLSETLREMTTALYRRIERSERFAADVAHELKNPLTSVRSAAETLALVKTDEQRASLTKTIEHDVRRLTRLIDDISNSTRLEAEMALSNAAPVDLSEILVTIAAMFNDSWREKNRSIDVKIADAPLGSRAYFVTGHETRLAQVFTNLTDNALSFSPEGGVVAIGVRTDGSTITVTIDDSGPGVPEESLDHIFNRFYTDRPGGAESFGNNSGLGLSIAREIVETHKGRIWAENRTVPGASKRDETATVEGARFVVELPTEIRFRSRLGRRR
ncbi:MAG: stimulus-sensing domain-containing protein [Hyphomicrobiaceae bacterium]